jgi:gliding motility-associated-like protein
MKTRNHLVLVFVFMCVCLCGYGQVQINAAIKNAICNGEGGGAIVVTVTGNTTSLSYSWSNGMNSAEISNLQAGTYTLTLHENSSLDTILSYTVLENTCELAVPLVFTPNGDGIQDTWLIGNSNYYPELLILVYNRWGQKVYENKGLFSGWDGKSLIGTPLDDATYYYIIYKDGNDKGKDMIKGSVTIVR